MPTTTWAELRPLVTDAGERDPHAVQLGDGSFWMTWEDPAPGGALEIRGQRYDVLGHPLGMVTLLNAPLAIGDARNATIAADVGSSEFLVAYEAFASGFSNLLLDRRAADGAPLGTLTVASDPSGDASGLDLRNPVVAVASATHGLVVFERTNDAGDTDIVGQFFNPSNDTLIGGAFDIWNENDDTFDPQVAVLSNGDYVVTFTDEDQGSPTNTNVAGRIVKQNGSLGAAIYPAVGGVREDQSDVAALAGGGFVVTHTHQNENGNVYATLYAADGTWLRGIDVARYADQQGGGRVVASPDGGFTVTWEMLGFAGRAYSRSFTAGGDGSSGTYEFDSWTPDAGFRAYDAASLADGRYLVATVGSYSGTTGVRLEVLDPRPVALPVAGYQIGSAAADAINAVASQVHGWGGNDVIVDQTYGSTASIDGGDGDDRIVVPGEIYLIAQSYYGGAGTDTIELHFDPDLDSPYDLVTLNLAVGTLRWGDFPATALEGFENITIDTSLTATLTGTAGDNVLVSTGLSADTIRGGAGNDRIEGGAGSDFLYGQADNDILIGGSGGDWLDGGAGADVMIGGTGPIPSNDTYYVDNPLDVVVDADSGFGLDYDSVWASLSYTLPDTIENLVLFGSEQLEGTGNGKNNQVTGNDAANTLRGLGGDDRLEGAGGDDRMEGGAGDDLYVVDQPGDGVIELEGQGIDLVESSVSFELPGDVENLTLRGTSEINGAGNVLANRLAGNSARNWLVGLQGNDVIDGGIGADRMEGGAGDDTYIVDNAGDGVNEKAGEGTDLVLSSINFQLGVNVENLTLTGTDNLAGAGNTIANLITGNSGNNWLVGDAGNDTLDGGLGNDRMDGGLGDDIYHVDNSLDRVNEAANQGTDLVYSSINFELGTNLENLTLTGTASLAGAGNALANRLTGNAGNNWLVGAGGNDVIDGGIGYDRMEGGLGDDSYYVDHGSDRANEKANEGTDLVYSSISFELAANVENLTLIGTGNTNAGGNALANVLTGNGGTNWLVGGAGNDILDGGTGADRMDGGADDDVYYVDNAGDRVTEKANEGTDTVFASVSYELAVNVENLTLTGSGDTTAGGNALANRLTGNSGANWLAGGAGDDVLDGGLGSDRLDGGVGLDHFWFSTALGASNVDRITDFVAADDTIDLDRTIFTAIAADGTLAAGAFRLGTAAADADDRILYDANTGNLWYDADGSGAAAAVLFARVGAGLALTSADFFGVP